MVNDLRAAICVEVVRLLRAERTARGISMNELARRTGLTQPTISILESSQPNPKLDSLLRIADALELDLGTVISKACKNLARVESDSRERTGLAPRKR